jgi:hypothetical protein
MKVWIGFVGVCGILVSSCGTPEFQSERSTCTAIWQQKIPPDLVQRLVNLTRAIQVPTGQTHCTTYGSGAYIYTDCTQIMRTEYIPYTEIRTVDLNSSRRDSKIVQCTASACSKKYGNSECKV